MKVYDIDESKTMYIYENHLFNLNDSHLCIKMDIKKNPLILCSFSLAFDYMIKFQNV